MHHNYLVFAVSALLGVFQAGVHANHAGFHQTPMAKGGPDCTGLHFPLRCRDDAAEFPVCSGTPSGGSSCWRNVPDSAGCPRYFLVSFPLHYDSTKAYPVVFSFHGRNKCATQQRELSRFYLWHVNPSAIAVYPQGVGPSTPQWQGDPEATTDDIAFTLDMIADLKKTYHIATDQIYATGKSNGGGFMNLLACDGTASKQIAAFAAASGAFYMDGTTGDPDHGRTDGPLILPPCLPGVKVTRFMEFHGTSDCTIFYDGGWDASFRGQTHNVCDVVTSWTTDRGCDQNATIDKFSCNNQQITRSSWNCSGVTNAVVHYKIPLLEHCWASTIQNDDCPDEPKCGNDACCTTCIDASRIMLDWLFSGTLSTPEKTSVECLKEKSTKLEL